MNSASPSSTSSATPPALMTASEFVQSAMVIPVRELTDPSRVAKLEVPAEHRSRMEIMRKEASAAMRASDLPDVSAQLVTGLLGLNLQTDLWYSRLPNGKTVVLVKEEIFAQLSEREIAEQVHRDEVQAAVMRGEKVPDETMRYYRHKHAPQLAEMGY